MNYYKAIVVRCFSIFIIALPLILSSAALRAETFNVNSIEDKVDVNIGDGLCADDVGECTLRAAIQEANSWVGEDKIILPPGRYIQSNSRGCENSSATGDLDITEALKIVGSGADNTAVTGISRDRVFHIIGPISVEISGIDIGGGDTLGCGANDNSGSSIYNQGGMLDLNHVHIGGNSCEHDGLCGGIYNHQGILNIKNSKLDGNIGYIFGGIGNWGGVLTMEDSTIENTKRGFAIAHYGGELNLMNLSIHNNEGGILVRLEADPPLESKAYISNCTFSDNDGAAVWVDENGSATMVNCTVKGTKSGIAVTSRWDGNLNMINCTVSENEAAGLYGGTVQNSIISNNSRVNCTESINSLGNNIDSDGTCGLTGPNDFSNTDPLLDYYIYYGNPATGHFPLLEGSPAIDNGNNSVCPTTDQLGNNRVDGDEDGEITCDIGAIEYQILTAIFKPVVNYYTGVANFVAIGDLNGDGHPDLAVASGYHNVSVLLGNGDGTFRSAMNYGVGYIMYVAIGDLDGDGHPDLAAANADTSDVLVLLGNGDGTFRSAMNYGVGGDLLSLAIGDLNGDGQPDLAAAAGNHISVLLGNGDGTFQDTVNYYTLGTDSVAIGDLNGDGYPDLAAPAGDHISVLLGNGDGTFRSAMNYSVGDHPRSVAIGDLNGDGHPDLAVASGYHNVSVLLGNGDGTFRSAMNYGVGDWPWFFAIGDLNGDGHPDLAVPIEGDDNVSVLLGNGDGTFRSAMNYSVGDHPRSVAIGDLNGDGSQDLAVACENDNVSILINIGEAENQPPEVICKDVTVSTESGLCSADASVDNGSYDPDGDEITLDQAPPGPYDLGDTDVTLSVTDDKGASDTCEATVTVVDEEAPVISTITASPNKLWPPIHKMVPVTVTVEAIDNCDSACQIISVASNEPVKGLGSGNTTPDWEIAGDLTVNLRAERSGMASGRIYTIIVECVDSSGNSSTDTVTVKVPHDKGKKKNQNNKKKK